MIWPLKLLQKNVKSAYAEKSIYNEEYYFADYERVSIYDLNNYNRKELGEYLNMEDKTLFWYESKETTIYVPKGTIIQKFDI